MITLQKIQDTESKTFREVWEIYEEAFPEDERRDLKTQKETMKKDAYTTQAVYFDETIVGLLFTWNFEAFTFIEHIAMNKDERNKGYGSNVIKAHFEQTKGKTTVLESEHKEEGAMAERRIKFYERLNMNVCSQEYIQPSYGEGKEPVPMLLVAYPHPTTDEDFNTIRDTLHKEVYGCKKPVLHM